MLSAKDCAKFFIYIMRDLEENDLSNLKLNKLLYYAQGHMLQQTGKPLFSDTIEAWKHGPVVADIYHEYKLYGRNPISEFSDSFNPDVYNEEEQQLLLDVAREYGKYSGYELRRMTHAPGAPWSMCYKEGEKSSVIPNHLIKAYFDKKSALKPFEIDYSQMEEIGYRDSEGYLVLPKEYDD